jgi:hypothetical protein
MGKNVRELNEKELAAGVKTTWFTRWFPSRFKSVEHEVRIGRFVLDLVATEQDGGLIVIELKIDMHHRALGQLLLYPHAVREKTTWGAGRRVNAMLITTHLDLNVVEVVGKLNERQDTQIELKVCVGDEDDPKLVDPSDAAACEQVWDQARVARRSRRR